MRRGLAVATPARLALGMFLAAALASGADAADKREKIAVMKVEAPTLSKEEVASLRDGLEVGVTQAVGTRLQVITKDSAAASVGGGDKLASCLEGASCDAEIGGALGVDYFLSGSVRSTPRGLELGVTILRIGRDVSLLKKEVKVFRTGQELLDGAAAHTEAVTRAALGSVLGRPAAPASAGGTFGEAGKDVTFSGGDEVVVSFESAPDGAAVLVDGQLLCKETPCRKRIAAGAHEASFQRERYASAVQRFTAADGAVVKATLSARFGWVSVETTPPGAGVSIDGADAGKSPVAWREVGEGTVEVAVTDPCFLRRGERVPVKAGERRLVKLEPKARIAGLKVNAEDEKGNAVDADVKVDGAVVGKAGAQLKIPTCSKLVTVRLGKETFEQELKLEEGKVAVIAAKPGSGAVATGMVRLPGGTYEMGETGQKVTLQPFLLDVTEVTVASYGACVKAGGCTAPGTGSNCNWGLGDRASHPVNCVDWSQATAFCEWARKRLPTEEEWEWAARGAQNGTKYPWGDDEPSTQLCWDGDGSSLGPGNRESTCPVGSYRRGDSPQGVKDLAGNVSEWTSSAERSSRVSRGGGWTAADVSDVTASNRASVGASYHTSKIGFRCAR
jgi:formylglycine-generating enzyme required for sulfatase activity